MEVGVCDRSQQFTFDGVGPEDIGDVIGFAYGIAERAAQQVYVLAFEVDGRQLGEPLPDTRWGPGRAVYLGMGDAISKRFTYGTDAVVWSPSSREWAHHLIRERWGEPYLWWGVLADRTGTVDVARSIGDLWPRGYGDLYALVHTVSQQRGLALLAVEGSFVSGRVMPEHWDAARQLLGTIADEGLDAVGG